MRSLIKTTVVIAFISILVYIGLAHLQIGEKRPELLVYAPPVLSDPVLEFSKLFEKEYGVRVSVLVQPTGVLLNRLEITGEGDVLFTADHFYMEQALSKNLVDQDSLRVVSYILPVLAVSKKSSVNINTVEDILRENATIGIGDPMISPFGRIAAEVLSKTGLYDKLESKIVIFADVRTVAMNLALGNVDAAILPHIVITWYPSEVELVWLDPELINGSASCQLVAVTSRARNKELAERFVSEFIRYMRENGSSWYASTLGDFRRFAPYDYTNLQIPGLCRS